MKTVCCVSCKSFKDILTFHTKLFNLFKDKRWFQSIKINKNGGVDLVVNGIGSDIPSHVLGIPVNIVLSSKCKIKKQLKDFISDVDGKLGE